MSYAPSAERSVEYRPTLDDTQLVSNLYEYKATEPYVVGIQQNPTERAMNDSIVTKTAVNGVSIQYRHERIEGAIPPRVKKGSVYEIINHHRGDFRKLTSVSIGETELMDLVPRGYTTVIKQTASPEENEESSCCIPWEKTILLNRSLDSDMVPLDLLRSAAHARESQNNPEWYAMHTNPIAMALATTVEFGGNRLYLQRMAWEFGLEHFDQFMDDNPTSPYDRQRMRTLMEADLKRQRDIVEDEIAHPLPTTVKRWGRAVLLGVAQSNLSFDIKTTPTEEAKMAKMFGYELQ